ncbi:MAG: hypothetical protein EHM36_08825 [Deltaproteobacteria bacterium]|nr:MAG: hypothetical protein EHM36_08825 [Deltaproteobacteria bacterium]
MRWSLRATWLRQGKLLSPHILVSLTPKGVGIAVADEDIFETGDNHPVRIILIIHERGDHAI